MDSKDSKDSKDKITTFFSGKSLAMAKLSPAGQILLRERSKILDQWIIRVRAEVRDAKNLAEPILINTLPAFVDNLAEALSPDERLSSLELSTLGEEHGGERARLTFYDPDELIREYQLFRDTLFDVLEREVSLSREERLIINQFIDASLREAVVSFALVQSNIREQFIATLTHDLRSPIGVIKMAAEIIKSDKLSAEESDDLLDRIIQNADRANNMIGDLLDATVVKSGGRLPLQLAECEILTIVESVVLELNVAHRNRFEFSGKPVRGIWSEKDLRRALENLCNNAIKYGDPSTPIAIGIDSTHGRMFFRVHNEGPPIPIEEQESIFQAFRRAHYKKKKGWGLGLPLVRGVAEAHGGSLVVDSKEGRGTTFIVDIPIDARPFQTAPVTE